MLSVIKRSFHILYHCGNHRNRCTKCMDQNAYAMFSSLILSTSDVQADEVENLPTTRMAPSPHNNPCRARDIWISIQDKIKYS